MDDNVALYFLVTVLLIFLSACFVSAEYALVSSRRGRLEARARKGSKNAQLVLNALDQISSSVATVQVGITIIGIGVGSISEPFIQRYLIGLVGTTSKTTSILISVLSFLIVTLVLVVLGELVPKYVTLRNADTVATIMIRPLLFVQAILRPIVWIIEAFSGVLLRIFGINIKESGAETAQKEELLMMIKAGSSEGLLDKEHADIVSKSIKLDQLMARDIMIHRMDVEWLDLDTPKDQILKELVRIPHNRIPVCRGDIDDLLGVVYIHDIVKALSEGNLQLDKLIRPAIDVPENLTLDKIIRRMQESKSQIVIVLDEYGGTSGLITLEDVVEEVFGELEDSLESERPAIIRQSSGRISARAEVRFDELVRFMECELNEEPSTETLATMIVNSLNRVPKLGDSLETEIGLLRVENMARKRITRVSLYPSTQQPSG